MTKIRLTGGEPLTRRDVMQLFRKLPSLTNLRDIGLSTNGTLLAREVEPGLTMAAAVRACGFNSVNISLDTLDRAEYARIDRARSAYRKRIAGIDAAIAAGFPQIKLNCVLMRGRNDDAARAAGRFRGGAKSPPPVHRADAGQHDRGPDARPTFSRSPKRRRALEANFGSLHSASRSSARTARRPIIRSRAAAQRIGFIGAMTNLHFCESCNKLRLTCDGKLRPCLGSYLEFDIMKPLRAGASDEELRQFFLDVVERKPEQHDFRTTYQPGRKMVAIGG